MPSNSCPILFIGKISSKLRYVCAKNIFKKCGKGVGVERLASFGSGKDIEIGDDVMMGPNFTCYTSNHKFDRIDIPMNKQGTTPRTKLEIGSDVWIGCDVLLMPGGYIPNGSVVAARSVVTKRFTDYCVLGGVPAKVIKFRKLPE